MTFSEILEDENEWEREATAIMEMLRQHASLLPFPLPVRSHEGSDYIFLSGLYKDSTLDLQALVSVSGEMREVIKSALMFAFPEEDDMIDYLDDILSANQSMSPRECEYFRIVAEFLGYNGDILHQMQMRLLTLQAKYTTMEILH